MLKWANLLQPHYDCRLVLIQIIRVMFLLLLNSGELEMPQKKPANVEMVGIFDTSHLIFCR